METKTLENLLYEQNMYFVYLNITIYLYHFAKTKKMKNQKSIGQTHCIQILIHIQLYKGQISKK